MTARDTGSYRVNDLLRQLVNVAVSAVHPARLMPATVRRRGDRLSVNNTHHYMLHRNVYLVGAGKVVAAMLSQMAPLVADHLIDGVVSVPLEALGQLPPLADGGTFCGVHVRPGAANNLPDAAAESAARSIADMARAASHHRGSLLVVLLSGGGSALLPCPRHPLSLSNKLDITLQLSRAGASIQQLNIVRSALSELKAGGLARLAFPAAVLTLVLSDVIDDQLHVIASGPTIIDGQYPASLMVERASSVLRQFNVNCHKGAVRRALQDLKKSEKTRRLPSTHRVTNVLLGSNLAALNAMKECAGRFKYGATDEQWLVSVLSRRVHGEANTVADLLVNLAVQVLNISTQRSKCSLQEDLIEQLHMIGIDRALLLSVMRRIRRHTLPNRKAAVICLLAGGESTVSVRASGNGGRCQQMALRAAIELNRHYGRQKRGGGNITLMFCGTDGQDGPTDAAGAICDNDTVLRATAQQLSPQEFLENNDSHSFFSLLDAGRWHLKTGLTGTNVMDLMAIVIEIFPTCLD